MKNDDDLFKRLQSLGFRLSPEAMKAFFKDAIKRRLSAVVTMERLAELETKARETKNLATRTKAATLGKFVTLDQFDWNHPKKIDRDLCDHLFELDFISKAHNVLLRGPSGVGKTTLASNLGLRALEKGHTVRFGTLASVLADLLRQESLPAFERRLKRYTLPTVLILDEIGYLPCDARSADLLYNIISRRHEERPTIITTNLPFKRWDTIFPGAACVGALVDRFTQHCNVLDIDAASYRQKKPPPKCLATKRKVSRRRRA